MSEGTKTSGTELAEVLRAARAFSYDDYLASLLAPAGTRADLLTLAALFGEFARIPLTVSDAALGEIRLQWWREALASTARTGHPVADAAIELQARLAVPLAELVAPVIEAYAAELYPEPFPSNDAFQAYARAPVQAAFDLRAAVLGAAREVADPIAIDAARTLGLVRTCVRLPYLFSKGRYPLPAPRLPIDAATGAMGKEALRTALAGLITDAAAAWTALRPRLRRISPNLRRVILPVALAGPYLGAIQGVERDVLHDVSEPSPLERSTRLWLAARLGRF